MKTLKNTLNAYMTKAYIRAQLHTVHMKEILKDNSGQFVVNHAVTFTIAIVLGALGLLLLKNFVTDDMAPAMKTKIMAFFN